MSTKSQSKPSREEAENFHVLPKRDGKKEQTETATQPKQPGSPTIIDRDVDAGIYTGQGDSASQVNQPLRDAGRDRSQVS